MIYIGIIIYLLICSFVYDFANSKSAKKLNYLIIYLIFVLLAGLRYRVGGDSLRYIALHEFIPTLKDYTFNTVDIKKLQPFWLLLSSFAKTISSDFVVLQLILAVFVNTVMLLFFKKYTKYYFTAALLYFLYFYGYLNFEILRESVSISIFLIALNSYKKSRWISYYAFVIIAFLFHYSSFILFFFPLVKKINLKFVQLLLIFIFSASLNQVFIKNLFFLNILRGGGFTESIQGYSEYLYSIYGLLSLLLLYILIPSFVKYVYVSKLKNNHDLLPLLNTYLLIGAITPLFYIFFRFLNYLTPILIIFIGEMLHTIFRSKYFGRFRFGAMSLTFLLITFLLTNKYFSDTSDIVPNSRWISRWYPYYSVLDKKEDLIRENIINNEFKN